MTAKLATEVTLKLNDGNTIPALGLGTVPSDDPADVKAQVVAAIRAGYRHIDTAWYYGTEPFIGKALKEVFDEGIVKREDLFITTKVWPSAHKNPEVAFNKSIADLGVDYVDLLLQHWPVCLAGDENGLPQTPFDKDGNLLYDDDPVEGDGFIDFYHRLEHLKESSGKIRSLGISNYTIPKLEKLLPKVKKFKPVLNQIEYHPQLPQQDLVDYCSKHGIIVEAYSPVGGTGAPVLKLPLVQQLAEKYDVSVNEITNAYHILNGRSTLPRSSNLARIKTNIHLPPLTKDELQQLYDIGAKNPKRYTNDPWGYGIGFKWWEGDKWSKVD